MESSRNEELLAMTRLAPRSLPTIAFALVAATASAGENPLLGEFATPFGVPPFDQIRTEHYLPAFRAGIEANRKEIEAIVANPEPATFANTVEALERSGKTLGQVRSVFYVLSESMTSDAMQEVANAAAPMMARYRDDVLLDDRLFQRIRTVWEQREKLGLPPEQAKLLEKTFKSFVRGGAGLPAEKKDRLRKVNEELSLLFVRFGDNVLAENNSFQLVLGTPEELAGIPAGVLAAAAEAAKEKGLAGKWLFTLDKPSLVPFLQYSSRRDLREKMFRGYVTRGDHDDEHDNKAIASRISALRADRAKLLGFESNAAFALDEAMAKTPDKVYEFLRKLWPPAVARAKAEAAEYQEMIRKEGGDFRLEPWDWFYYANKVLKERYALDDELLRPYFKLENVIDGAFGVATKLYGIKFIPRTDVPKYHEDVRVYEVTEADGRPVGVLYVDYFPRPTKRGGAWMNSFRDQSIVNGKRIVPIISNNGNFTKPTADTPSLLTLDEVSTLFHEFGHALHGLLSNSTYEKIGGTSVATDFVELPSQIMENWATHPDVLKLYAKHYKTGKPIPQELIDRIRKAELFDQGFRTVEYLAASFLDMDWNTLREAKGPSVPAFEKGSMERIGIIPEIVSRYRTTYFAHIFSSDEYAAGYYSYVWAEVLDADAFEAFKEKGIFDRKTAESFRKNILERGGTEDPMVLYRRFRGAEPKVEPLLRRRGLM
jgi:peptidyl-dipeptidase Dcp